MPLPEEAGDEHAGLVSRTASRSALGLGKCCFPRTRIGMGTGHGAETACGDLGDKMW